MKGAVTVRATSPRRNALNAVRKARIVNDARTRLALQEHFRQQAHEVIAFDERAVLVEEEAAVVVAIPSKPDIGAGTAHGIGRVVNPLGEPSNSSIIASDGELFIRTHKALWCVK